MLYWFDAKKAAQAASVLLDFDDGKMEYIRLLKLLYIADRQSIVETGRPISYSRSVGMSHGPLSSEVYELIRGERDNDLIHWSPYIRTHGYNVSLIGDPGRGKLSKFEIEKLNELSQHYENIPTWEIVRETHNFSEWEDPKPLGKKMKNISFTKILDALQMSAEQKQSILEDMTAKARADQLFSGV